MSWTITKANNAKMSYKVQNELGKSIDVNVPSHLIGQVHVNSFIEGHTSSHDALWEASQKIEFLQGSYNFVLKMGLGVTVFLIGLNIFQFILFHKR